MPAGTERAEIETPDGRRVTVPVLEGRAVFLGTQAGLYRLHAGVDSLLIAGNLQEPDESRCAPRRSLRVHETQASTPGPGRLGTRREIWLYLVAAALVILLTEWLGYHRRITV